MRTSTANADCALAVLPVLGWRWLLIISSTPLMVFVGLFMCFGRESPRYLLGQGRVAEAERGLTGRDAVRGVEREVAALEDQARVVVQQRRQGGVDVHGVQRGRRRGPARRPDAPNARTQEELTHHLAGPRMRRRVGRGVLDRTAARVFPAVPSPSRYLYLRG